MQTFDAGPGAQLLVRGSRGASSPLGFALALALLISPARAEEGVWLGTLTCDAVPGVLPPLDVDFALRIGADGKAEYRAGTDERRRSTGEGEERGDGKLSSDGYLVLDGGARGMLWTQAAYYTGPWRSDRIELAGSQTLRLRDGVDSHRRRCRVVATRSS